MTRARTPVHTRLPDFLDAKSSLAMLRVRPQTLYAYVSRGAIRSVPQAGTKAHLYSRADIERVVARAAARAGHAAVAAAAMDHGAPIVSSGITEITAEAGPAYRGHVAIDLARRDISFEKVCELLWTSKLDLAQSTAWRIPAHAQAQVSDAYRQILPNGTHQVYESLAMLALQLARSDRLFGPTSIGQSVEEEARLLICASTEALGCIGPHQRPAQLGRSEPIAAAVTRAFGGDATPTRVQAVNAMLVLLADHELPPGTLAVRAAASGGAHLFDCIAAGICASAGTEIAGHYAVVDRFLFMRPTFASLRDKTRRLYKGGLRIPGFTHPIYPRGDPRATYLLEIAAEVCDDSFPMRQITAFLRWAAEGFDSHPRHEFAVVCLVRALGLPSWCASALFLLARMGGWGAHVEEQRGAVGIWRPRARFVTIGGVAGSPPEEG